ncbi:NAD(P)-dependent dehydrogenase (short-subunit alcohol dehydrogenase family) [Pseudonocardia hierapolitana]|uniref:NAD(P)-dependent dehydrogenase (Short-subunit alcohol dehydrogenase family) n=1 Tax=Pseudonocardia hierapolitana TaxID=1128676 RepID=A0A561SYP9_9PSEU|nr:SDR family oxidoreductase [Pseudonocardia hierapolitana]TWF79998.1 NAD(P)-dependent dehydrogenase (short-subunit alcohol dehydrogenase family) [Pseudonocardia hierapolitana]
MRDVLVVTGGSRGIGAAVTRAAHARGYAVGAGYASDDAAADRLRAELPGVVAVRADVADPASVTALFDATEAAFGPVTALVNNAGVTGRLGAFTDAPVATLRRVLDVNVLGTMLCAQEALRRWADRGTPGRIVNVSSRAATLGSPGEYVHYAASKAAVETFTRGLAKEVAAQGIRVNCVAPGTIHTDIHAAAGDPARPERVAARVPMGRAGEPEEIAAAVLWLLSAEASYVTGAVLQAGGGI